MFNEEAILEDCRKGKREAQERLYKQFVPVMLGVCSRYAGSRDEAEDILQEGFLKVFQNLGSYRKEGSLEGWIKRIMINHALNYLKKRRRNPYHEDIEIIQESEIIRGDDNPQNDPVPAQILMSMVQSLPDGYRTVFNLFVFESYTHQEIAEALQISENTSKTQLLKARRLLQKKLMIYYKEKEMTTVNER